MFRDSGRENGNYYGIFLGYDNGNYYGTFLGYDKGCIRILEKEMETTMVYSWDMIKGCIGIMERKHGNYYSIFLGYEIGLYTDSGIVNGNYYGIFLGYDKGLYRDNGKDLHMTLCTRGQRRSSSETSTTTLRRNRRQVTLLVARRAQRSRRRPLSDRFILLNLLAVSRGMAEWR